MDSTINTWAYISIISNKTGIPKSVIIQMLSLAGFGKTEIIGSSAMATPVS